MTSASDNSNQMPNQAVLAGIRMLLLDVDGVLTDGRIHFDVEGREYKSFHVHDAAGIIYWHRAGGLSGFLSGRGGHVVERRAKELGVHEVILGRIDKADAFADLLQRHELRAEQVAYVGDDLGVRLTGIGGAVLYAVAALLFSRYDEARLQRELTEAGQHSEFTPSSPAR